MALPLWAIACLFVWGICISESLQTDSEQSECCTPNLGLDTTHAPYSYVQHRITEGGEVEDHYVPASFDVYTEWPHLSESEGSKDSTDHIPWQEVVIGVLSDRLSVSEGYPVHCVKGVLREALQTHSVYNAYEDGTHTDSEPDPSIVSLWHILQSEGLTLDMEECGYMSRRIWKVGHSDKYGFWDQVACCLGLMAAVGGIVQTLLGSRFGPLERYIGLDRMWKAHRLVGISCGILPLCHVLMKKRKYFTTMSFWDAIKKIGGFYPIAPGNGPHNASRTAFYAFTILTGMALLAKRANNKRYLPYLVWYLPHLFLWVAVPCVLWHSYESMHMARGLAAIDILFMGTLTVSIVFRVIRLVRRVGTPPLRVVSAASVSDSLTVLTLRGDVQTQRSLAGAKPGQFVVLTAPKAYGYSKHPFSALVQIHRVGAEERDTERQAGGETKGVEVVDVTLFIRKLGLFTTGLRESLEGGDKIHVEGPYGLFTPPVHGNILLVAAGSGIAPMLSMLDGLTAQSKEVVQEYSGTTRRQQVTLSWSTNKAGDLMGVLPHIQSALSRARDHPSVSLFVHVQWTGKGAMPSLPPTLDTDTAGASLSLSAGRVSEQGLREDGGDAAERCYICGTERFIEAVTGHATSLGIQEIHFEVFRML
ncbi:hypothetical protein KIPB_006816 [Kipferlia bialata]|uniref:FAD-binding FR-type domain-containing protein n=1 Tax=Kipferlia bialata TaxID=797122 RepID=A0A9K3GIH4_9EUKA|nr:hypothetical protein KIPB_006816 [Kipferlia bialata]|eukprot:g6816.t1